jgi:hypothetical protein
LIRRLAGVSKLFALVLFGALSIQAHAALAWVSYAVNSNGIAGVTSVATTINSVVAGNDLVILAGCEDKTITSVAIPGLTLTPLSSDYSPTSTGTIAAYTVKASAGGSYTATATTSAGTNSMAVWIIQVGGATALTQDVRGNGTGANGTAVTTSASATSGSLVITLAMFYPSQTGDTGWTFVLSQPGFSGYHSLEYKLSSGGSETANWNGATSGNGTWYQSEIAVKNSGGGGGPTCAQSTALLGVGCR